MPPTEAEKQQILALADIDLDAHAKLADKNGWEGKADALELIAKGVKILKRDEDKERSNYLVPKGEFLKEQGRGKNYEAEQKKKQ